MSPQLGNHKGNASALQVSRRSDDNPCSPTCGSRMGVGLTADGEREIRAFGDEILVSIWHHQFDFEFGLQRQEAWEPRYDLAHTKRCRQTDALDSESRPNHVFRVASGTKVFTGDN